MKVNSGRHIETRWRISWTLFHLTFFLELLEESKRGLMGPQLCPDSYPAGCRPVAHFLSSSLDSCIADGHALMPDNVMKRFLNSCSLELGTQGYIR